MTPRRGPVPSPEAGGGEAVAASPEAVRVPADGRGTRPTLSVVLITLNEERLLERVLESVAWADEIVVVDSGSTDLTEAIARRFTDRFFVRAFVGEGEQRRRALELSTGEWILALDGDEVVTPELARSILAAIAHPGRHVAFRFCLSTFMLGRWFGTRGWRREWKTRLFARRAGGFDPAPVHSGVVVDGPIGMLEGRLLHYPYRDLDHLIAKLHRYSSVMAEQIARRSRAPGPLGAAARGGGRFLRDFFLGGDFLYGGAGLVRAATAGYFTFLKYAKAWEKRLSRSDSTAASNPPSAR